VFVNGKLFQPGLIFDIVLSETPFQDFYIDQAEKAGLTQTYNLLVKKFRQSHKTFFLKLDLFINIRNICCIAIERSSLQKE
jgi:hypothetical protein